MFSLVSRRLRTSPHQSPPAGGNPSRRRSRWPRAVGALAVALGLCAAAGPRAAALPLSADSPALGGGGAVPASPTEAIGDNTFGMLRAQVEGASPDDIHKALRALLGPAAAAIEQVPGTAEFFKQYEAILNAGYQGATAVAEMPPGADKPAEPVVYFAAKPGSDLTALRQALMSQAQVGEADKAKMAWDQAGNYLVMREKGQPMPKGGSAERAKAFAEALEANAGKPFVVVFSPGPAMRQFLEKQAQQGMAGAPPPLAAAVPALIQARWVTLAFTLGETPRVELTVNAADEASAKQLTDQANQGLAQVKQMIDQAKNDPNAGQRLAFVGNLLDTLKPTQAGTKVTVVLEGRALAPAAAMMLPALMKARAAAAGARSASNMRQLLLGVIMYANEHNDQLPDKLEDVKPYVGGAEGFAAAMSNPRGGPNAGYLYVKPAARMRDVKNAAETAILFELANGQKVEGGVVGYLDGHVDQHGPPLPRVRQLDPDKEDGVIHVGPGGVGAGSGGKE